MKDGKTNKSAIIRMALGTAGAACALAGAWHISYGAAPGAVSGGAAQAGTDALHVDVSGVRSGLGFVIGTLCREGEAFVAKCSFQARSKATDGVVSLDFTGLPTGDYALALYHDENGNAKLELGAEGIGFSNNANLAKAIPDFDASRIKVSGKARIRVRLRYTI